eukprot:scaffold4743_cov171-Amphora_coffeaeformis.AAC.18
MQLLLVRFWKAVKKDQRLAGLVTLPCPGDRILRVLTTGLSLQSAHYDVLTTALGAVSAGRSKFLTPTSSANSQAA